MKPPFPRQVLKDVMLFYQPGLERVSRRPIGLILLKCGMFPGEDQSRSCKCMRWYGDVWAMGAVMTGKCMAYLWISEEGELHLVMDANVSKPIQCLFSFFISLLFLSIE
jgi:hypothetical protein